MSQSHQLEKRSALNVHQIIWLAACPVLAVAVAILSAKFGLLIVLAGCTAVGLGVAVIFRPDLATIVFLMLTYSNAPVVAHRFYGVPKMAAVLVVALLLVPLAYYLVIRRQRLIIHAAIPWIFAFIVVQLVSSLYAGRMNVSTSIIFASLTEGLLLFGLIINVVRSPQTLKFAVWSLLIAGAFLGALSVYQKATNQFDRSFGGFAQVPTVERNGERIASPNPRSVGPIGEKNYYAQFMLFLVPLGLISIKRAKTAGVRRAAVICVLLILAAIGLTASRGAALGFVVMLFLAGNLGVLNLRQIFWLVLISITFAISSDGLRSRANDLFQATRELRSGGDIRNVDKSVQGRASEMLAAIVVFQKHAVLGVGAGNFPMHFARHSDVLGFQIHQDERLAHCTYLEIAAETGIFGLICFLSIFYVIISDLLRARRESNCAECRAMSTAFLLTIFVMLVTSAFLSFAFVRYYWLILALAACSAKIAREHSEPANSAAVIQ